MAWEINWHSNGGAVLLSPQYQRYSQYDFAELATPPMIAAIKTTIGQANASNESAAVISYLMWLIRVVNAIA